MDDISDGVRSFFEMVGLANKRKKEKQGKVPRQGRNKANKGGGGGGGGSRNRAVNSRTKHSSAGTGGGSLAKVRSAEGPPTAGGGAGGQTRHRSASGGGGGHSTRSISHSRSNSSHMAGVFAPRLLPVTGAVAGATSHDHSWLSIREMVEQGFHCAVYLIHCAEHGKVAVSRPSDRQALWMPFTPIPPNRSWEEAGQTGLLLILSGGNVELSLRLDETPPFTERSLLEVHDVQLPQSQEIMKRLTWYVRLEQEKTGFRCCEDSDSLLWVEVADIGEQAPAIMEHLWGTELVELTAIVGTCLREGQSLFTSFDERSLEAAFKHVPRNPPVGNEQQLLYSAHLTEKDIERLYSDYIEHCHPAKAMASHSFKVFLTKYGLRYTDDRLWAFFRAFNASNSGAISFPELLIGLACIDNSSIHNEERAAFVLRYYDVYRRGFLTEDDLRLMLQDIHALNASSSDGGVTEESIEEELAAIWKTVRPERDEELGKNIIRQRRFLSAVGSHKIRGTSKLCRLGKSICTAISSAIFMRAQRTANQEKKLVSVLEAPYHGSCVGCRAKKAQLEESVHRLTTDGYSERMERSSALKPTEAGSAGGGSAESLQVPRTGSSTGAGGKHGTGSRVHRKKSHHKSARSRKSQLGPAASGGSSTSLNAALSSLSSVEGIGDALPSAILTTKEMEAAVEVAARLMHQLRAFAPAAKGDTANPVGFQAKSESSSRRFLEHLETLERALVPVLRNNRVVQVPSPVYVVGDIHGNVDDLLSLERSLWKRFPLVGPNVLFLGDIVDRGKWSVECATYLFCLLVLAPEKVTLLRGNHEVRSLQCNYSYQGECISKYGDDVGLKIWQLTNRVFEVLPLCAVVDGAAFCAHGGIPRAAATLEEIAASLPAAIGEPQSESPIAWEILWSDPMTQPQFIDTARTMQLDISQCGGFLPNRKRGTAWAFSEDAVDRFLAANGLSHIFRAHEVPANGFSFLFDKKCTTVFSCSHYCGNGNECAVLYVDRDQIRPIRIDTSNNASATD